MKYTVEFLERDFSFPIVTNLKTEVLKLAWSAFGGPDQASIRLYGPAENLLDMTRLLRSPVTVYDPDSMPVWWGFVSEVIVYLEEVQFQVSIEDLFNKVKVIYSFLSPDNKLSDQYETSYANNTKSQVAFGIKERAIVKDNIDTDCAEYFRDTFLEQSAWPKSQLSQRSTSGYAYVLLHCSGWFATMAWTHYQDLDGFYANYGPGPGSFIFDSSLNDRYPSQRFRPSKNLSLQYVYFQISRVGATTRTLTAQLRSSTAFGNSPNAVLATSNGILGSTFDVENYYWLKFEFPTPYVLSSSTYYWVNVTSDGTSATDYFSIRTDENNNFFGHSAKYYDGAAWQVIPSILYPTPTYSQYPDLIFRFVCISDTSFHFINIATAGDQFFTRISAATTGTLASPFRNNRLSCLQELINLMNLGTSNGLMVLANVTPERQLLFYEQPDPSDPQIYLDRHNRLFTAQGIPVIPSNLIVGHTAVLTGTNRITQPFDRERVPACFIQRLEYFPVTRRVKINAQ